MIRFILNLVHLFSVILGWHFRVIGLKSAKISATKILLEDPILFIYYLKLEDLLFRLEFN